ncbi:HAMP domain-containing sensor histidine kinase [Aquidulcibacter sp.]|uniref:sensor histidine kinase n=1 Tax=Aquidulcibacter sp. TaxID=2052990 RepID=UPI0028ADD4E7|nr:HAMP domain-containing sensor histidine kinase [Aquidulcibacter sp.]
MVGRKLIGSRLALQVGGLAILAVVLSNILTVVFFFGDRNEIIRTIVNAETLARLTPVVTSLERGEVIGLDETISIRPAETWTPAPDAWQESPTLASQIMASSGTKGLRVFIPRISTFTFGDLFQQVQKGGPQVAALVTPRDQQPLAILIRVQPDLPPPLAALVATLISGILITFGTSFLIGRMTQPLTTLAAASENIGQSQRIETVPVRGPLELRIAAGAFNRMAQRISQLLDRQRATLWALGHDLRTPVTAMLIRLELVDDDETRDRLRESVREIERVVEDALFLARSELATSPMQIAYLDELVDQAISGLIEANPEATGRLSVTKSPKARILARPNDVVRAIRNLIHNALRHTQGPVQVIVSADPTPSIEVGDWGPGLPVEVMQAPGEPFVRGDQARSSNGSTGLGLAIVRSIVEAHKAKLGAENRRGESGAVMRIDFDRI